MKTRTLTGLLIGIIVIPLLLLGNIPFMFGITLLLGGVAYEISSMKNNHLLIKLITIILITATSVYNYFNINDGINLPLLSIFIPIFIYYRYYIDFHLKPLKRPIHSPIPYFSIPIHTFILYHIWV